MINLLFTVVLTEMTMILILLFRNPLRKLVILGMNQLKQGKGPLVAKTVATTLVVVFTSVLHNALQIRKRLLDTGAVNSTDEILMADRVLEATLLGFSLFLALMIDRLHYYIKDLFLVRNDLEEVKRVNQLDYKDKRIPTEREGVKQLESDSRTRKSN
uniref:Endoplasmic reticulum transmembrane protein n=1 Tax=Salix viminalis TaxID=40686 RepID=A0A6N2LVV1_SALVM